MSNQPRARMIYAVPPDHLKQENGTSQRLKTLRSALAERFELEETNLLNQPLRRRERLAMLLISLIGPSNNWRYLALSHRLPPQTDSQLTLLLGNYCACLALLAPDKPLMLDLVDRLTLTDVRGMQSGWRWRPLIYLAQLPSSWLLEHCLRRHSQLQAVLITTEREKAWLERLHGSWANLHVVPNQVQLQPGFSASPAPRLQDHGPLQLAFIGSLNWWVNQVSARRAVLIGSKTAPVEEVIEHQKNGLLVDFFDYNEIAHTISRVLSDYQSSRQLGINARKTIVDNYDLNTICLPKMLNIIETVSGITLPHPITTSQKQRNS